MSTLHTVNKSPFSHSTLISCLSICGLNDGILLLEDGVFGAIGSSPCSSQLSELMVKGLRVYALTGDIKARGLQNKLLSNILIIDYEGFVRLSTEHRCVQSWY